MAKRKSKVPPPVTVVDVSAVVNLATQTIEKAQAALDSGAQGNTAAYLKNAKKRLEQAVTSLKDKNVCCPQGMQIKITPDWEHSMVRQRKRPKRRLA